MHFDTLEVHSTSSQTGPGHIMARGQSNTTARNPLSLKVHQIARMRFSISYMSFKNRTIPASSLEGKSLSYKILQGEESKTKGHREA